MNYLQLSPDPRWIQTFTGRAFCPLSPQSRDVCIEDIAHALSMKCRFTGHCREFYSVAQHSYFVSTVVPELDALWGLMHDAAEAYLPDVARPIKNAIAGFRDIEYDVLQTITQRFGLSWPMPMPVRDADMVMLATEQRDLMSKPPYLWTSIEGIKPLESKITAWEPRKAEEMFLHRFKVLTRKL
jgi:hypothetical protein